jgi:energy-coupling factor transporter ATP-binding protein EcfA2
MESYVKLFDKLRIERGTVNMFYGNEGNGKTTAVYHLMKMIGGAILYIDTESGRDMDRFRSICGDSVFPISVDVYNWVELCQYLKKCVREKQQYDMVVIDCIAFLYLNEVLGSSLLERAATLARVSYDIGQIYQNIRKLTRTTSGVGVWINWHASEMKGSFNKRDFKDVTEGREFLGGRMAGHLPKSIYKFGYNIKTKDRYIDVIKAKNIASDTRWMFKFEGDGIKLIE